jgi:transcriptional regulator with XRE-family HTH domain
MASDLEVSQSLVSRWEAGLHEPSAKTRCAIERLLRSTHRGGRDAAVRRLVENAADPIHLICDDTHMLLAASPAREREWQARAAAYLGSSLWRFATPQIVACENTLSDLGWFDDRGQPCVFVETDGNGNSEMRILPSTLMWEKIALEDGRIGRLVTTVEFK